MDVMTNAMDMNLGKLREMTTDREVLAGCNPWGGKESDTTGWLNNTTHGTLQKGWLMLWKTALTETTS